MMMLVVVMMVVVVIIAMADVMMMMIGGGNDSNGRCDDDCAHRKNISWHPMIRPRCVLVLNHLSWKCVCYPHLLLFVLSIIHIRPIIQPARQIWPKTGIFGQISAFLAHLI